MVLANGVEVAGYRIEGVLGRGGMGEVYEATQLSLGRTVALKVLRSDLGADVGFRARFQREGRIQAGLDHPNIVTVHEAGALPDGDGLFLAMRLVRGPTLKELIRGGDLDPARTLALLGPIAAALDAAHAAGLTHRDVKPQNILIGPGDHPYLADFGLTRGGEDTALTRSGAFMGTIDYVAPEVIRGEPATAASDIYALTCVVYECLSGTIPFPRETDAAALYAHVHEPPQPRATALGLPAAVDRVLAAGMAKEADERPERASDLLADLRSAVGGTAPLIHPRAGQETVADEPTPAAPTRTVDAPRRKPRGARRTALLLAAAVCGLAAGAFAVGHARQSGARDRATTLAAGTAVELRAPASWTAQAPGPAERVPGMTLHDGIAVTSPVQGAGVQAGIADGSGPTLLPASLRTKVTSGALRPERVTLGRMQALRYRGLSVRGLDPSLTLFAVPTTAGVATVACTVPAASPASVARDCDLVAASLQLRTGKPLSIDADPATARRLDQVVRALARDRAAPQRLLTQAGRAATQARAARSMAGVYGAASAATGRLRVSPAIAPAVAAITTQAAAIGHAYTGLGRAAAGHDAAAYRRAAAQVSAGQARLRHALVSLREAGYRVG